MAMPKNTINSVNYPTIAEALKRAEEQKVNYERNLLNKRFIYAFVGDNNQIDFKEVVFKKSSYLHLTGLDYKGKQSKKRQGVSISGTDALNFYKRLGTDTTLINDVSFTQGNTTEETQRYFGYTQHKLDNLAQLTQLSNKAEFIGKYTGDRDFDIIVNRNMSSLALYQKRNVFLPASLLFGKPQKVATNIKPILAIFSREKDTHQYTLEYLNKNISLKNVKMDIGLSQRLNLSSFENTSVSFNRNQHNELISIYMSAVKYDLAKQLKELSSKREKAFDSEADMNEYMKSFNKFIKNINEEYKKDIAIELLSNEAKCNSNNLVADEISAINEKFGLSAPTLSVPTANKPMQMSITEGNNIPTNIRMQGNGTAVLYPAIPPNGSLKGLFNQFIETLVKGLDNTVHSALTAIEKINQAVTKAVHSMTAPKSHSEARRASQSKNKGNSPKKKQVAKKAVSVAPAKRSEKQEQRSSVLGDITSVKKELEQQRREAPTKEKHISKKNNIEI